MLWMLLVLGVAVGGFVAVSGARKVTVGGALEIARQKGDIGPLVAVIEAMGEENQPTAWNQAIDGLWRTYHREAAAALIVQAALRTDAGVVQYWIQQTLQVEPEIAAEAFSEDFLATCFRPQVAASCGKCGPCGCG